MLKLVFFDLDGTIVDTIPMCIDAFGKAISPYTGHSLSKDEIIQTFGLNEIGMIKSIVKENWEKALQDFYIKYEELHFQCDIPFEGIIELIEMLKSKGILVALVTGKGQKSCDITLQRLKMNNMFSDIMTGSEYRNCKKDLMLELINKYNLSEECLYIGDAISDVTISNELGVTCFSAAWAQSTNKSNKLALCGISLKKQTEEYTSQCSPHAPEVTKDYAKRSNRTDRGLYKDQFHVYNADAVGAFNIMRKYIAVSGKKRRCP